jgi:nitrile hydratase accessory protein
LSRPEDIKRAIAPGADEPVFAEPWQAQAFALVIALRDRGVFGWDEWARALSDEVHRPEAAADGHDYYEHWMRALEGLLASKGIASAARIDDLSAAWQRAAHATPHGKPIELANDPHFAERSARG